jgi:FkbM family methyltransferase
VFDIGANVGQSALMALISRNVENVVLVDANWEALSVAAQNIIRNAVSERTRFICAFVSDTTGNELDFWTVGTGAAGSMFAGHAVTASRGGFVRRVKTVTLDEIATKTGLVPDLVKVDVEGAEASVLRGATSVASRAATRFIVEMHSPPELSMRDNAQAVLDWAASVDYAVWYLSEGVRVTTPEIIAHRGRCHLLVQPRAWDYPDWLVGIEQSAQLPTH